MSSSFPAVLARYTHGPRLKAKCRPGLGAWLCFSWTATNSTLARPGRASRP